MGDRERDEEDAGFVSELANEMIDAGSGVSGAIEGDCELTVIVGGSVSM